MESAAPDPEKGRKCEDERCTSPSSNVHYCVDCDSSYCEGCWGKQAPHKPGKVGRDGIEHERTIYELYEVYKAILFPPSSQDRLRQLHDEDISSLWFGESANASGEVASG